MGGESVANVMIYAPCAPLALALHCSTMDYMKSTSFRLNDHYTAFLGEQVATGRFKTTSEVVMDALRQYEAQVERDRKLIALLDKAMEGESHPFDPETFKQEMREKYADKFPL